MACTLTRRASEAGLANALLILARSVSEGGGRSPCPTRAAQLGGCHSREFCGVLWKGAAQSGLGFSTSQATTDRPESGTVLKISYRGG